MENLEMIYRQRKWQKEAENQNESKWAKYTNPTKVFKLPEQEKQGLHERNRKKVQK